MITLRIDTGRLNANIEYIKERVSCFVYAVVKADAYGHGAAVCKYIENQADGFAVSCASEAGELVDMGIKKPVLIMCPSPQLNTDAQIIYTLTGVDELKNFKNCRVAIKVNTGMNRLGVDDSDFKSLLQAVKQRDDLILAEVFTHFYSPDGAHNQFKRFKAITKGVKAPRHCLASSCLMLPKAMQMDAVRCGIALYGYAPGCKPVLSAYTETVQIRRVQKGEHIGYGDFVAPNDMTVAVLAAGYADGIRRINGRKVRINGAVCNITGNVCMDLCMADVSGIEVKRGDKAYFVDDVLNAEFLAAEQHTVPYEIMTAFNNKRVRRVYV